MCQQEKAAAALAVRQSLDGIAKGKEKQSGSGAAMHSTLACKQLAEVSFASDQLWQRRSTCLQLRRRRCERQLRRQRGCCRAA